MRQVTEAMQMRNLARPILILFVGLSGGCALAQDEILDRYLPLRAANQHHKAVVENDCVRVLDVRIPPGDTVAAHQHDLPSVFITVVPADLTFRNLAGETVKTVTRPRGTNYEPEVEWREPAPAPRLVSNRDSIEMRAIRVEVKPSCKRPDA
jgi:hypothetical protein